MNHVLVRSFIRAAICPSGLLLLVSDASAQQNSIENFDVTQSGGQVLIRHTLKNPIEAPPGSFTIASPARIAFDFPDTTNGLGRNSQDIVVELSDTSTGVGIRQQGQTVIVDFLKTSVSDVLRKRYDVVDFATPVQTFSAFPQGDNVRMVIEPRGLWEHNAYQTDTQFVLEVKPIQYDPNKLVQGTRSGYSGEKLSLNFQNVEVRSVLNVIADFTDLNIITSDTVGGNLTLRLKDVPWDQALDIILQTR